MSTGSGSLIKCTLLPCISFLLLFIFSCNSSKPPPQEYFIPRDKLVDILIDMHMTYGLQATPNFREMTAGYDSIDTYSLLFLRHETSKEAFDSTMVYYSKNPDELVNIYDEVIMNFTMINDSLRDTETDDSHFYGR